MPDADDRPLHDDALRWLCHPTTCVAVAVLLLNDHVLKAAFGTWWTGKLSDAAGLLVAPPLVTLVLALAWRGPRPRSDRVVRALAVATVGALFALVKVAPLGAAVASAAWSLVDGPGLVRSDATDLAVLPVLALAWRAGAGTRPGPGGTRRPTAPARWLVVLPVAVLATVATSAPAEGDAVQAVAVVDGVLVVRLQDGERLLSTDGETWTAATGSPTQDAVTSALAAAADQPVVCRPDRPDECYRPLGADDADVEHGPLGVERSTDGGRTWRVDWVVPAELLDTLARRYDPPAGAIRTRQVAVLPTSAGDRVYAANGGDGLAVRHDDGTWERLGHPSPEGFDDVVPIPGRPDTPLLPVPPALPVGVAVALVVVAASGRRPDVSVGPGRRATGVALLASSGVVLAATAVVDHAWRTLPGGDDLVAAVRVLVLVALLAAGLALVGAAAAVLHRGAAFGLAVLVGAVVVVTLLVVGSVWAAVAIAAVAATGGVVLARRSTARHAPWPDEPLPWGRLPGSG